jgi:hypothetical protein
MIRIRTRVGVAALALAGVIAVAGCTTTSGTKAPTPSPRQTASASSGKPALSRLVASPDGLGYLTIGAPVPVRPAATAIVAYNPTKCVSPAEGITAGSPGAGAWLPAYPDSLIWSGSGHPFDVGPVRSSTDPISEIEIWTPQIKTAKGIGAGSTPAQLTVAYGSSLTVDRADNSDVYVLKGVHSELLFEVAKAAAGLPTEETGTVVWMRIVPLGSTQLHIANTDAAGPCDL